MSDKCELKQKRRQPYVWSRYCDFCEEKLRITYVDWKKLTVYFSVCDYEQNEERLKNPKQVKMKPNGNEEGWEDRHFKNQNPPAETHPWRCSNCHAVDSPVAEGKCINCGKEAWKKRKNRSS
jgi:hypothetical protein